MTKNSYIGGSRSSMFVASESSSAVIVIQAASLCLSATVLTLDELIVVK